MTRAPLPVAESRTDLTFSRYSSIGMPLAMSLPPAWNVMMVGLKRLDLRHLLGEDLARRVAADSGVLQFDLAAVGPPVLGEQRGKRAGALVGRADALGQRITQCEISKTA